VMSMIIIIVIVYGTWGLLRDSLRLSLDGVPHNIDPAKVGAYFSGLPEVSTFHDLHIWAMSTTEAALTVHVVVPSGDTDALLLKMHHDLHHNFNIEHATIQLERSSDEKICSQKCDAGVI